MRATGLRARGRRRFIVTTKSDHGELVAPHRLRRHFGVRTINRVWAADITACWTREGWCYLAVILDLASRRVVGWPVHRAPGTELGGTAAPETHVTWSILLPGRRDGRQASKWTLIVMH